MYRAIIAAALSALWLIGSNAVMLSGTAHAGNAVKSSKSHSSHRGASKSSKSNTSDRRGGNMNSGNPPPPSQGY